MKAFLAVSSYKRPDKDVLILAKTKKDALVEFKSLKESMFHFFKTKDFKEVEIETLEVYGMDIISSNYKHYKDSDTPRYFCFEPRFQVRLKDFNGWHNPDQIVLAETEQTHKLMIETFKQQNKEMLSDLF